MLYLIRKLFGLNSFKTPKTVVKESAHTPIPEDFYKNLLLTQIYCDGVLKNNDQNIASKLRTINPLYQRQPIFTFSQNSFTGYCQWRIKPFENKKLINKLFDEQLVFKTQSIINAALETDFKGKIVIADFDDTVVDGASEAVSAGLFDVFDLPPIDTWFYLETDAKGWRRMFAWIPDSLVALTNEAIAVNCVCCIFWR